MGLDVSTKAVPPTFPLFFHERLRFERVMSLCLLLELFIFTHQYYSNCPTFQLPNNIIRSNIFVIVIISHFLLL